jgi:hypothetical protein
MSLADRFGAELDGGLVRRDGPIREKGTSLAARPLVFAFDPSSDRLRSEGLGDLAFAALGAVTFRRHDRAAGRFGLGLTLGQLEVGIVAAES